MENGNRVKEVSLRNVAEIETPRNVSILHLHCSFRVTLEDTISFSRVVIQLHNYSAAHPFSKYHPAEAGGVLESV